MRNLKKKKKMYVREVMRLKKTVLSKKKKNTLKNTVRKRKIINISAIYIKYISMWL